MSQSFARPTFPPEICELCIDALADTAEDDELGRTALAQCLRVSHVFWTRARRHVFSHVHIQVASSERPFELVERQLIALLALMTSDDGAELPFSVTTLIKSFTLDVALVYDWQSEKTMNLPSVEAVLKEFLKAGVLHSLSILTHEFLWDGINPATQNLIHRLCRAPHLKALSLPGACYIPTQFWEGATIKDLTLRNVRLGIPISPHKGPTDIDTLSSPPDLNSLKVIGFVCDSPSFQSSLSGDSGLPFSRLQNLISVFHDERNLWATKVIALRSHRSLHTLHLLFRAKILHQCNDLDLAICDLNRLPSLRHLKLSACWICFGGMGSIIEHFCQLIPQEPGLKSLAIQIDLLNMDESSNPYTKDPWKILEKHLVQSRVPRIELVIKFPPPTPPNPWEKSNRTHVLTDAGLFVGLRGDRSINFTLRLVQTTSSRADSYFQYI